jgi:hypothetical protein
MSYSVFPDYIGINYIKNQKAFIEPGGCSNSKIYYDKNHIKDIRLHEFIEKNRNIITNSWLLRYHDSLKLKTKS